MMIWFDLFDSQSRINIILYPYDHCFMFLNSSIFSFLNLKLKGFFSVELDSPKRHLTFTAFHYTSLLHIITGFDDQKEKIIETEHYTYKPHLR